MNLVWTNAVEILEGFGGEPITLYVPKTGLPFFDTLRLYGAIEIFIGLREETEINDEGYRWKVNSRTRQNPKNKTEASLLILRGGKKKRGDDVFLDNFSNCVLIEEFYHCELTIDNSKKLQNPDSSLKDGVRGTAASKYNGLESGFGNTSKIPLSDAILVLAGQKRVRTISGIYFLPVFEGKVDFSKIISPIRSYIDNPNAFLIQVYELLELKISLFAEGYQDRLSAVVYNTNKDDFNYSGIISIDSTAIKRAGIDKGTVIALFQSYKILLQTSYKDKKTTEYFQPTLNLANWIVHPQPKYLSYLITSQEILSRDFGFTKTLFLNYSIIKNIFTMTYEGIWSGDQEAVQKLAKAVSSAIYQARQKDESDSETKRKRWYDEVVMLRSAPNAKAFRERVLILLEQGHKEKQEIGTAMWNQDFNPVSVIGSMGNDRHSFEIFRDLFRMYLIQESVYKLKDEPDNTNITNQKNNIDNGEQK